MTKVGLWYLVATAVVALAATNTGNNGLFLTVASMAAAFVLAHVAAWLNVSRLEVRASAEREIYANQPAHLDVEVRNRGRFLPSWLVVLAIEPADIEPADRRPRRPTPWLVPHLPPRAVREAQLEVLLQRRGPRRLETVEVTSLFPLGLFRRGRRFPQDLEVLVYPEIFSAASSKPTTSGRTGERTRRRPGLGHELHTLREYRPGDDPRGIHWKQTARQRRLIFQQRQSEKQRRLRIVFDNAVGLELDESDLERFERLVSEAATAAVEALESGFEVSLLTRDVKIAYGTGPRQRRNVLEALARVEAQAPEKTPLGAGSPEPPGLQLRLGQQSGRGPQPRFDPGGSTAFEKVEGTSP